MVFGGVFVITNYNSTFSTHFHCLFEKSYLDILDYTLVFATES